MERDFKKITALLAVWFLCADFAAAQPGPFLSPLQGGEDISTAFVLTGPFPINASGTTEGYLDDYDETCPYPGSGGPDVVYAFSPAETFTVDIDLCGSGFDTKVYVYENTWTPGFPFDCNDDFYFDAECGLYVSKLEGVVLTSGNTYYIVIDGSGEGDYGEYVLTITGTDPTPGCTWGSDIFCPPLAFSEDEDCGADANGGCDMAPGTESWETVPASGGIFCGTTWASLGVRDTDWFELVLEEASSVIITADGDQEIFYGMVETNTPGTPSCETLTGFFTPGNTAGPCDEKLLDLGTLVPGTYWFIVKMNALDGFPCDNHYRIGFDVIPIPCPAPELLTAQDITPSAANLAWSESRTATAWEYQYGLAGFTPGESGTPTVLNPAPVAGLSANTGYEFYVRADCGEGIFSDWSGPQSFATPCVPYSIPWSENFDTMTSIGNNILPQCWAAESFTGTPWSSGDDTSVSQNDPCSSPNYVFVDYSPYPIDKFLITPGFALSAGISYDFSFFWAGDGKAGWTGDVRVNAYQAGSGATVLGSPFLEAGTTTTATCNQVIRSFIPSETGTYYFVIRVNNTVEPDFLGFDDFALDLSPECPVPGELIAGSITNESANLTWAPGGDETEWEYIYGESPLAVPAGSGISATSNTFNPVAGLSGNTGYQFYVRAKCGEEFSEWAGAAGFVTLCDPVTLFPWTDGFESAWPPECWTDEETADFGWDEGIFGSARSGSGWAYCNLEGSLLSTPPLELSSGSWLEFWFRVEKADYPQDLTVMIGNDTILQISSATNETYQRAGVSLAAYTGQVVSITFTGGTGTGGVDFGICMDDVTVKPINTWTGNISNDWNTDGNWSLGAVPGQNDIVLIPSVPSGENFPVISNIVSAECSIITLEAGASILIETGGALHLHNP